MKEKGCCGCGEDVEARVVRGGRLWLVKVGGRVSRFFRAKEHSLHSLPPAWLLLRIQLRARIAVNREVANRSGRCTHREKNTETRHTVRRPFVKKARMRRGVRGKIKRIAGAARGKRLLRPYVSSSHSIEFGSATGVYSSWGIKIILPVTASGPFLDSSTVPM